MAYKKTNWQDTIRDSKGEIIQKGTPLNAQALSKIEDGIVATEQKIDTEIGEVTKHLAHVDYKTFYQALVNRKASKFAVTIIDDDGHKGVYTKYAPILRELGVKMTSAVITNREHGFPISGLPAYNPSGSFMSYTEMKQLQNEGLVEFICHTHTHDLNHRLTDMSEEEIHADLSLNQNIMRTLGFNDRHLVFPFGSINELAESVAKQYFESAFNISGGVVTNPFNQYRINRFGLDGDKTFNDAKEQIDLAKASNTWLVIMTHVDQYGGMDLTKFRQTIEYALSQGAEFITVDEGINRFGNLAQFGATTIDNKGNVHSNTLGTLHVGASAEFEANAPITAFEKRKTTIVKVRSMEAELYGLESATGIAGLYGKIEVHRDSEDTFSYQKFISTNRSKPAIELKRHWNTSTNAWEAWYIVNMRAVVSATDYTPNAPITAFPKGKPVRIKVREIDANLYGLTGFGVIDVCRDRTEDTYSTQIYRNLPDNTTLMRSWNNANSKWGTWEPYAKMLTPLSRTVNTTVTAQSTYETSLDVASIKPSHIHLITPTSTIPAGVMWDCYVPFEGRVTIRLANVTNADITLTDVVMQIKRMG